MENQIVVDSFVECPWYETQIIQVALMVFYIRLPGSNLFSETIVSSTNRKRIGCQYLEYIYLLVNYIIKFFYMINFKFSCITMCSIHGFEFKFFLYIAIRLVPFGIIRSIEIFAPIINLGIIRIIELEKHGFFLPDIK